MTKGPTSCLCLRRGKENRLCWLAQGRSSEATVNTLLQLKFVDFITALQVASDLVFCGRKVTFSLGSNRETGPGCNAGRLEKCHSLVKTRTPQLHLIPTAASPRQFKHLFSQLALCSEALCGATVKT